MRGILRCAQDDDVKTGNGKNNGRSKSNGNSNSNGRSLRG